jgi:hypothetical protein
VVVVVSFSAVPPSLVGLSPVEGPGEDEPFGVDALPASPPPAPASVALAGGMNCAMNVAWVSTRW